MQDDDIDKEMLDEEPKKRVVRRAKPAVEGINTPKTTRSNVVVKTTGSDEREQRIVPECSGKKTGSVGKTLAIFVFVLILIAAAYEIYTWNKNRGAQSVASQTPTQTQIDTKTQTPTGTNTATSTLDMVPAATSTPTTVPTTTPATVTRLTINQTPTGYLNVRSTPSSSGKLLIQVHPGETYTYIATKSGWYQIMLSDGTSGWVIGQYVTVIK